LKKSVSIEGFTERPALVAIELPFEGDVDAPPLAEVPGVKAKVDAEKLARESWPLDIVALDPAGEL